MKPHIDDDCDDSSCDKLNCIRRHPKECIYFRKYKRCKFDPCKYLHTENDIDEICICDRRRKENSLEHETSSIPALSKLFTISLTCI